MAALLLALCAATALGAPQIKVGCIGDSITYGVCGSNGGYPTLLQAQLGGAYQVANFGNSGKTMLKYGQPGDSAYWNQTTWPAAQAFNADIYTILLGTNDAKNGGNSLNWFPCTSANGWQDCSWVDGDNYTADYIDMISILKAQPAKPRIFLMQPTPLYKEVYFMNASVINFVLPRLLPTIAAATPVEPQIIDLFNALGGANLTQPGITCDGCHPHQAGYVEMANAIYAVLSKTIAEAGWPGYVPATAQQLQASLPRKEWNTVFPEGYQGVLVQEV